MAIFHGIYLSIGRNVSITSIYAMNAFCSDLCMLYKGLPIVLASFAVLLCTWQHVCTSIHCSHFPRGFSPHFGLASGWVSCEFAVPHRNYLPRRCSPDTSNYHWARSPEILPWRLDLQQEVSWAHGLEFLSSTCAAMFRAAGLLRAWAQWLSRRDHHGLPRRVIRGEAGTPRPFSRPTNTPRPFSRPPNIPKRNILPISC